MSKYNVGLKTLLLQGLSEPEFYGDLVYKFRKIIGKSDFPYHLKKDSSQCIFDFEIRKKQMFTEARAFSRVTYFLFSGEPAGFFS